MKSKILWILLGLATILVGSSVGIQIVIFENDKFLEELSKTLMTLGATVIIGGLLKILLEDYRKVLETKEKLKEFKTEILHELRRIYDEVELSRLLIESHKSAKTYGERIRQGIIPSKISLYDIKRTLVDGQDYLPDEKLQKMRLSIHFMIAYLQSLIQEYQDHYFKLSNLQSYQEKIKEKSKSIFSELLVKDESNPAKDFENLKNINKLFENLNEKNKVPDRLLIVWNEIDSLNYLNDFLKADIDSNYYRFFFSQYDHCKRIIKSDGSDNVPLPTFFKEDYLNKMIGHDEKRKKGEVVPDFDLVIDIYQNELKNN